ncbi:MAG: TIGR03936 family radical SAM-associated protein [Rubripirellula sp.]
MTAKSNPDEPRKNDPNGSAASASVVQASPTALRIRYRIRFAKTGLLRWIGHQDLVRLWERMARRADLKLSMTEGFTPKPRFVFPSAMALGMEGSNEVIEIELANSIAPAELMDRLVNDNQPGMSIVSVKRLPEGFGKAQLARTDYRISGPCFSSSRGPIEEPDDHEQPTSSPVDWIQIGESIQRLMATESVSIERKKKTVTLQVAEQIHELRIAKEDEETESENHSIVLSLIATNAASLRPDDVLGLLGLDDWIDRGATITRTNVHLDKEFETDDLDEIAIRTQSPLASMRLTQSMQSHQASPTPVRGA